MGWYDAFKGNTSNVNVNLSKNGNAMSAFGDAFLNFGKVLQDDKVAKEKSELIQSQLDGEKINQDINLQKKADMITESTNSATALKQKNFDDAFVSEALSRPNQASLDANWENQDGLKPSANAMTKVNTHFKTKEDELEKADIWAQNEFNDELTKIASSGKYKTIGELKTDNPDVWDLADGKTTMFVKNAFADDSTKKASFKAVSDDAKHQIALLKKEKEIIKLIKASEKEGGYNGETTDGKIASLVKTSMGLDNEFATLDDKKKQEFIKIVSDISVLAKNMNLTSGSALSAYTYLEAKKEKENKPTENVLGLEIRKKK